MKKESISISQAAEIVGLSRQTILHHINCGHLPAEKIGKIYVIKKSDLALLKKYHRNKN